MPRCVDPTSPVRSAVDALTVSRKGGTFSTAKRQQRSIQPDAPVVDDPPGTVVAVGTVCKRHSGGHASQGVDTEETPEACRSAAAPASPGAATACAMHLTTSAATLCEEGSRAGSIRASPSSTRDPRGGPAAPGASSSLTSFSKSRAAVPAATATWTAPRYVDDPPQQGVASRTGRHRP